MLFFSSLHDPNMVPTLQQLVLQLTALRSFADCTTHMDFVTLRKRLLVCSAATQSLENFITRCAPPPPPIPPPSLTFPRAWAPLPNHPAT